MISSSLTEGIVFQNRVAEMKLVPEKFAYALFCHKQHKSLCATSLFLNVVLSVFLEPSEILGMESN